MIEQLNRLAITNLRGPLSLSVPAYSGGQPSAPQLEQMADLGIGVIINLRPNAEMADFNEAAVVRELALDYVQIEIASAADLTLENVHLFSAALGSLSTPVFMHCAGGNRVGALVALKASLIDNIDRESALELGLQAGLSGLQNDVINLLSKI